MDFDKKISNFLDKINLCVVQTGRPQDAYTLFEVMNDRALALDELDLIKNQFFRAYVLKNPKISTQKVDALFDKLDDLWVNKIFPNTSKLSESSKKLTCYLATVFISAAYQLKSEKTEECRKEIVKYHDNLDVYTTDEIERDFNIFYACKIFIEETEIRAQRRDIIALKAEYSDNSQFKKAATLINSLGLDGVLAGLVSYALNTIKHENPDFDPDKVKTSFREFALSNSNKKISEQSYIFWGLALLAKNYEEPKALSDRVVKYNNLSSSSIAECVESLTSEEIKEEFKDWLEKWSYNTKDIKVRVLFAILLRLKEQSGTLVKPTVTNSIKEEFVSTIQLDHMEAQKIQGDRPKDYFDDVDRSYFVNGLGNMMPLPGKQNVAKGNKPMKESFKYLQEAGLDESILIVNKTKEIFQNNKKRDVPTRDFFAERKSWLIDNFYEAIKVSKG